MERSGRRPWLWFLTCLTLVSLFQLMQCAADGESKIFPFFLFTFFWRVGQIWRASGKKKSTRNSTGFFFFKHGERDRGWKEWIDRSIDVQNIITHIQQPLFFPSLMSNSPNFYIFSPLPPPLARAARHIRTGGKRRLNGWAGGLVHHIMEKLEMAAEVCPKRLLEYYPLRDEREKKGQKFFLNFFVFFFVSCLFSRWEMTRNKKHGPQTTRFCPWPATGV